MFIYLFIIKIGKLESCLDIFIYYIIIGEDQKIGYIISKYNYILDIFWIYLYILFKYVYLFIYYNKIGENCKIEGQLLFWIYYIQI